tara:strand:- start:5731 stop:6003 length:273 start_codon:yes stop_codon:yes gene_type:complete
MSNTVTATETQNTISVNETTNTVTVTEGAATIVRVATEGPQGPQGTAGSGFDLDSSSKVDKSVVYYDSSAGQFKADDTWTITTLVFGGDF